MQYRSQHIIFIFSNITIFALNWRRRAGWWAQRRAAPKRACSLPISRGHCNTICRCVKPFNISSQSSSPKRPEQQPSPPRSEHCPLQMHHQYHIYCKRRKCTVGPKSSDLTRKMCPTKPYRTEKNSIKNHTNQQSQLSRNKKKNTGERTRTHKKYQSNSTVTIMKHTPTHSLSTHVKYI